MTIKIIKGASAIEQSLKSLQNRGARLDRDIHIVGVSVLAHASDHGDTTLADKLVHALPKGSRKLALVEWMLAHGQLSKLDAKADKDAVAAGRIFKIDRTKKYDEDGAIANVWTEYRKESHVLTAFDAQAAVASVLSRLKTANTKGLAIANRAQALAEAQALVAVLAD